MKSNYQIHWFPQEDGRHQLRASIGRDGKLRLGRSLREVLPTDIQVGFDEKRKMLAIADGHGRGTRWPKCGIMSAKALSREVMSLGLKLPLSFRISKDPSWGCYLGHITPRRRKTPETPRGGYDQEQISIIFQHIIDAAVKSLAKSTPLNERRSVAKGALLEAAHQYHPWHGDMEAYLEAYVHRELLENNKVHISAYQVRSLDQALSAEGHSPFCLYDTLEVSDDGGLGDTDERIMMEQFLATLSERERQLTRMLQDGFRISQIADRFHVSEDDITDLAHGIAQKRREFYTVI